jgi:tRNA-dihydrouridine synthase
MLPAFADLHSELRGSFFLPAMHEIGTGAFCASHSAGCRLVQLGSLLAEPPVYGIYLDKYSPFVLPPDPRACIALLEGECAASRRQTDVLTCLNLVTPQLDWALAAARCFLDAGGDLVELNLHGSYARYLAIGRERAMVLPEHKEELLRWVRELVRAGVPLIVKLDGRQDRPHVWQVIDRLRDSDMFGLHVDIRENSTQRPDFLFATDVRQRYPGFLMVSGYVRSAEDARKLFAAGIDMIGIAEPLMTDPNYISRIVAELSAQPT